MPTTFHRLILHFCLLAFGVSRSLAAEKTTYDDQVFPIFQQSCLNCHNPDKTKGGLDLSSFSAAMKGGSGGKIAEPGDASSKILTSIMRTADPKMPPEGDALGAPQVAIIKAWIDGGLLENANSTARKPSAPKFSSAMNAAGGARPEGPPPMPRELLLEPPVVATRGAAVRAIACSPWAPLIAVSSLKQVLLIDLNTLELIGILPFPEGEPVCLHFTPDARYLIVGGGIHGKSGTTVTFDVTTGVRALTAAKEFDCVLACDIRPGFDQVITGSPARTVKFWNSQNGELGKSIKKHTDWVTALDISPDGILCASGDRTGGVYVWEADSGKEFHTLRAHQAAITQAAFRQDSNILGTASEDGTIRFWEMNGGTEVKKIDAHPGGVTGFDWSRDGGFATIGRDLKAKLWKVDFNHVRDFAALPALPTAIGLDPEGKRCFVGDINGEIHVFDCGSGAIIAKFGNNPPTIATRISALDESIRKQSEDLTALPKDQAAGNAKKEELKKAIAALEAARARWRSAAVNTRALAAETAGATMQRQFEERTEIFSRSAAELEKIHAGAKNLTRELQALQLETSRERDNQKTDPASEKNRAAAIAGKQKALQEQQALLHKAESELIELRNGIEENSRQRVEQQQLATRLKTEYRNQLKQPE